MGYLWIAMLAATYALFSLGRRLYFLELAVGHLIDRQMTRDADATTPFRVKAGPDSHLRN